MKNTTKIIISLVIASIGASQAMATPTYNDRCSLMVFPFDLASAELIGAAGDPFLNELSESICNQRLIYPNAYTPQPPIASENPVKSGAENKRVPIAKHEHGYFNDKNSDTNYYYKSFVDKFEITLESDGKNSIDLTKIACYTPVPSGYAGDASDLKDCNGYVSGLWGGTRVTKTVGTNSVIILWDFATDSPNSGRPQIYANNGSSFKTYNTDGTVKATLNLTDPYNRLLEFGVDLRTNNNSGNIWSATTTSRVLIGDLALKKTNYPANFSKGCTNNNVNDSASGWCYLTPSSSATKEQVTTPSGTYSYYWYNIGSVGTVWKKPPTIQNTCTALAITPTTLAANTPQTFTVTPTTTGTLALTYRWSTAPNSGTFKDSSTSAGTGVNPFTDNNTSTYYSGGAGGTVITVEAIGPNGATYANCKKTVTIPKPQNICTGLTISPNSLTERNIATFTVTPSFTDPTKPITLTYRWTATGSTANGLFADGQLNGADKANPYTDDDNQTFYFGGEGNTKITVLALGPNNVTYPNCRAELTIPQNDNFCTDLKISPSVLTPNTPINFKVTPTFNTTTNTFPLKIHWMSYGSAQNGSFSDTSTSQKVDGRPPGFTDLNYETYYTGGAAGTTIKVEAISGTGNLERIETRCVKELTIPPTTTEKICKNLIPTINGIDLTNVNQLGLGQSYTFGINQNTSLFSDNSKLPNYNIIIKSGKGELRSDPDNATSCPTVIKQNNGDLTVTNAPASCRYNYNPVGPVEGFGFFYKDAGPDKVPGTADDIVPACSKTFVTPPIIEQEICENINLSVNGQLTNNPLIEANRSYLMKVAPETNLKAINQVIWNENGAGKLISAPTNYQNHPGVCPAEINDTTLVTSSLCQYIYATPAGSNETGGFSVEALLPQGVQNSPNCKVASSFFTPPTTERDRCLYVDLDYQPEPFSNYNSDGQKINSSMTARVALLSGKPYTGRVAFSTNDGQGAFSGGISGNGNNPFNSAVDNLNSTGIVNYIPGQSPYTGVNVYLTNYGNLDVSSPACQVALRPVVRPPENYVCEEAPTIEKKTETQFCAEPTAEGQNLCWSVEGTRFLNGSLRQTGNCVTIEPSDNFKLNVEDCNQKYSNICYDSYNDIGTPSLEKKISRIPSSNFVNSVNYTVNADSARTFDVYYRLVFRPENVRAGETVIATILDDAFDGKIESTIKDDNGVATPQKGTINIDLNSVKVEGYETICSGQPNNSKCHIVLFDSSELKLQGIDSDLPITITYKGKLTPGITLKDCQEGKYCNERFENTAEVKNMNVCTSNTVDGVTTWTCNIPKPELPIKSNKAIAELVCQYFLTRASGDVFIENTLRYGIDISKCYPYKNVGGPIVKPIPENEQTIGSTGADSTIINIGHEICSAGQTDFESLNLDEETKQKLEQIYGSNISESLSSQICEIGLVPGTDWTKDQIKSAILANVNKLTRWASSNLNSIVDLNQSPVYYFDGNESNETLVTLNTLTLNDGDGAKTIIIKNADLYISGDIKYGEGTVKSASEIASLGIIVIDGNLIIGPEVETLSGAYLVISTVPANDKGQVKSGKTHQGGELSENQLTIYGSLFGNVSDLFKNRVYSGEVSADEGAVTIRYDQRIIENPPAGLAEIFGDLAQSTIAQ